MMFVVENNFGCTEIKYSLCDRLIQAVVKECEIKSQETRVQI